LALIDRIDLGLNLNTSGFDTNVKKAAKSLQDMHGITARQADALARFEQQQRVSIATWGKSADRVALWKMKAQGVPAAALKNASALTKQKEKLDKYGKGGMLGSMVSSGASSAMSGMASAAKLAVGAVAAVGAAAVAAATGIAAYTMSCMGGMKQTAELATTTGMSAKAFSQLSYAAQLTGTSQEQLAGGLEKMNKNLSEASMGSGPAYTALKGIGLNAQELKAMKPDEAFKKISDGIKGIASPADRARVAMDIFGKSGQTLLPTLMRGSEELDKFASESDKTGNTVSDADAKMAEDAINSVNSIWKVFEGFGIRLAAAVAPYIKAIAEGFKEWATNGLNAGEMVGNAMGFLRDNIGYVAKGFYALKAVAHGVFGALASGITLTLTAVSYLLAGMEKVSGADLGSQWVAKQADTMKELAQGQFKSGYDSMVDMFSEEPGQKLGKAMDEVKTKADKSAEAINANAEAVKKFDEAGAELSNELDELLKKMNMETQMVGMLDVEKKIFELRKKMTPEQQKENEGKFDAMRAAAVEKGLAEANLAADEQINAVGREELSDIEKKIEALRRQGATEEQLAKLKGKSKELKAKTDEQKHIDELKEKAKGLEEAALTPQQKLMKEAIGLQEMFQRGMISAQGLQQGMLGAVKEGGIGEDVGHAAAIEAGSSEGYQAILKAVDQGQGQQLQQQVAANTLNMVGSLGTIRDLMAAQSRLRPEVQRISP
jgi:hypothetical protein